MFSSTPEYVRAVISERERDTQLVLRARAVERMVQAGRPHTERRAWAHLVAVRLPRTFRVWSA